MATKYRRPVVEDDGPCPFDRTLTNSVRLRAAGFTLVFRPVGAEATWQRADVGRIKERRAMTEFCGEEDLQ